MPPPCPTMWRLFLLRFLLPPRVLVSPCPDAVPPLGLRLLVGEEFRVLEARRRIVALERGAKQPACRTLPKREDEEEEEEKKKKKKKKKMVGGNNERSTREPRRPSQGSWLHAKSIKPARSLIC